MSKQDLPQVVRVEPSPFPAWVIGVHNESGRVIRRFKSTEDCDKWLSRHGYEVMANA